MTTYEYTILEVGEEVELLSQEIEMLNALGKQGWCAYGVAQMSGKTVHYLRREIVD